ncbi:hypothetical protein [Candidatus Marimicrobium litorale]|uniref:Uncharacterized protein n=1 Tax=Candidatus Marimicrobium litorale TaxID=2518991 RepID=A0ABT3T4K3_9GAMM|nr:hypothetical protein [Candidatus Marimicrobium litorale]MCX2977216.1 hypothetical protein [Candidatus Marimicrobium litorale]
MDNDGLSTNSAVSGDSSRSLFIALVKYMRVLSALCAISAIWGLVNVFFKLELHDPAVSVSLILASALAILQAIVYWRPTIDLKKITETKVLDFDSMMRGLAALASGFRVLATLTTTIAIVLIVSTVVQ